ncbi:MAG: hypothetical protein AAGF57_12155 [Pseudomonadota bacterium]
MPLLLPVSGLTVCSFNKSKGFFRLALYASLFFAIALVRVLGVHFFRWGESQAMPWYTPPWIFTVPA